MATGYCTYSGTGVCFSSLTRLAAPALNMLRVLAGTPQRMRCAHRQRRLVPADKYVYGARGSNDCPSGSKRITDEAACRAAATAMGTVSAGNFVEDDKNYPSGCYRLSSEGRVYLNTAWPGAEAAGTKLLCGASPCCGTQRCRYMRAPKPRTVARC